MKKKGLKKARSIGKRARESLSTEFLQGDNSTTEEQLKQINAHCFEVDVLDQGTRRSLRSKGNNKNNNNDNSGKNSNNNKNIR